MKRKTIMDISEKLDETIDSVRKTFENDDCLIIREFILPKTNIRCAAVFIESMADDLLVTQFLMKTTEYRIFLSNKDVIDGIYEKILHGSDVQVEIDEDKIILQILSGSAVLFADGSKKAIVADTKGYQSRSVEEPENEKLLRGPREGFTEKINTDISLIRRRILTTDLKIRFRNIGRRTHTKIAVMYLESLVKPEILTEVMKRLSKIDIDGILDSNYIEEQIRDRPLSPFKTVGSTERPDTVAARLLEGRVAIIVNGSPVVLTVPFVFVENFQSGDDYYSGVFFANIGRVLRYVSFFLTLSVPAVYVALMTFHRQMMPTEFALSIVSSRSGVPFPVFVETLGLLIVFELLRETSVRMPTAVGQTLSVVGAIVIGESAVSAKIVSAPTVIVVGLTAITGLMIPRLKAAMIYYRAFLLFCSGIFGLYGYIFGCCLILIRLLETESFGVEYVSYMISFEPQQMKDTVIRVPWTDMIERPKGIAKEIIRQRKQ